MVIIIAVLASMIVPNLWERIGQGRQSVAKQKLPQIENAIEIFMIDYSRVPQTLDELITRPADIDEAKWHSPTLKAKDLLDPWERQFIFKQPGDHGVYDLYSLGKDGQEGGDNEDADVCNW